MKLPSLRSTKSKLIALTLLLVMGAGIFLFMKMRRRADPDRILADASKYYQAGELDSAKILYGKMLQLDPKSPAAHSQLGMIWAEQGDPMIALFYLVRAKSLDPDNLDARKALVRSLASIGDFAGARKEAEELAGQFPKDGELLQLLANTAYTEELLSATEQQVADWSGGESADVHLAAASIAFRKKDTDTAESEALKALAISPESASAHVLMGNLYAASNDAEKAEAAFKAAAQHAPPRSAMRLRHADFKMRTGKLDEARAMLEEVTNEVPDFMGAWLMYAKLAQREGKYDEVQSLLENVFRQSPQFFPALLLQGQVLLAKGDREEALESFKKLKLTKPFGDTPAVEFHLAQAYLLNASPDLAVEALERALAANPKYAEAKLLLAQLHLRSGKPELVISPVTELITDRPDLTAAPLLLADAYRLLRRLDEAADVFRAQIESDPEALQPRIFLGLILRQQGNNDGARAEFEKAGEIEPDNPLPNRLLAELDLADEDYDSATRRVQEEIEKTPDSSSSYFLLGRIHFAQDAWDAAETALLKTIELDPVSFTAYDRLSETYVRAGKLPKALEQLQSYQAANPKELGVLLRIATLHQTMGEPEKARDAYENLLAARPDYAPALNNLAWLYAESLGDPQKAREVAKKARELLPEVGEIADTFGWILYKQGDYQQALFNIREASNKLPDNLEIQYHLGLASYMMGELETARAAFEKAAGVTEETSWKADAESRLANLAALAEASVADLEQRLGENPNDVVVLIQIGAAHEVGGEYEKAAASYLKAVEANPKLGAPLTRLAVLYAGDLNDKEKATSFAERARELVPGDPHVAGVLGKLAYEEGKYEIAFRLLQESAASLRDDPAILYQLGQACYSVGKVDDARQQMQRLLDLAPADPSAEAAKVFLSMTVTDPAAAKLVESEAARLLANDPNDVPALMVQIAKQIREGDLGVAERSLGTVLAKFPKFAPAEKYLARVLVEQTDKLDEALDLATNARRTLGEDHELLEVFAIINFKKGEFSSAIQLFETIAKAGALDADALYYLGMAHHKAKNTAEAAGVLQQALDAGLDGARASEAKSVLEPTEN